jgi:hypothetical protein
MRKRRLEWRIRRKNGDLHIIEAQALFVSLIGIGITGTMIVAAILTILEALSASHGSRP